MVAAATDLPTENARVSSLAALAIASPCDDSQILALAALRLALPVTHGQLPVSVLTTLHTPLTPAARAELLGLVPGAAPQVQQGIVACLIRNDLGALADLRWSAVDADDAYYGALRSHPGDAGRRATVIETLLDADGGDEPSAWAAAIVLARELPRDHPLRSRIGSTTRVLAMLLTATTDERVLQDAQAMQL